MTDRETGAGMTMTQTMTDPGASAVMLMKVMTTAHGISEVGMPG